jgi:bifunctional DNA-binding transcriptional regulator/antitoxin component of YhaV-PrlF toxin-antitoxin module
MLSDMSNSVSTITSKWQVTIPEDVRKELPLKVGQRITWEVEGDKLVARRIRSISELSGCLKSDATATGGKRPPGGFAEAAVARHDRISRQKPGPSISSHFLNCLTLGFF